ncbi:MAG: hypothetical protein GY869_23785 [Planctomycetes bacterium]|nr:hypothetical protein [Planctomycetota bacterium]
MKKILFAGFIILVLTSTLHAQLFEQEQPQSNWQFSFVTGFFHGEGLLNTRNKEQNAALDVDQDTAWLWGVRLGTEQEYLGWDITAAAAFADLEIDAHPLAIVPEGRDLDTYLANINALFFPTGYNLNKGRIRPFITGGIGFAHFDSNFDYIGAETMLDLNAGGGVKFMLDQADKYHLRLDWRWHYLSGGGSGVNNTLYRQELTIGFGFTF